MGSDYGSKQIAPLFLRHGAAEHRELAAKKFDIANNGGGKRDHFAIVISRNAKLAQAIFDFRIGRQKVLPLPKRQCVPLNYRVSEPPRWTEIDGQTWIAVEFEHRDEPMRTGAINSPGTPR